MISLFKVMDKVFANGPRDWGSIPGRVRPKTQKMVIGLTLLNNLYFKVQIQSKWSNTEKWVAPFPKSQYSSYWKGAFQLPSTTVTILLIDIYIHGYVHIFLDLDIYIYIYIYYIYIYIYLNVCIFKPIHKQDAEQGQAKFNRLHFRFFFLLLDWLPYQD